MRFDIITLFPKMFESPFAESMINHAQKDGKIEIVTHQLRDYATDKHHTTDDTPYGGGPGMVIKVDVVDRAIALVKSQKSKVKSHVIMLSASGEKFTQAKAIELAKYDDIILLCGHYEGFDYRVHEHLIDEEISIGDYVLTGGEIPAMVVIDTVSRMVPGVIKEESVMNESHMPQISRKSKVESRKCKSKVNNVSTEKLEAESCQLKANFDYPVYTRPVEYKGWRVPDVLQSGNHAEINKWRESHK